MNGRVAKKIRKAAEINVYQTYVGLIQSMMKLPFKKRMKFGYCLIFKRPYIKGQEKRGWGIGKGISGIMSKGFRRISGLVRQSTGEVTNRV